MSIGRAKQLIGQRENIRLEFKVAANALPSNIFETICAMLNREGGDIILGVDDSNVLQGVNPASVPIMISNLVNLSNNPQKLDPPFILFPQTYTIDEKIIIHIQVPSSSQVHKTANTVFDRSNDGDFRVIAAHQIADIYNRKRNFYTEGIIYPALRFEDFRADFFPKIRNLITSNNPAHPWLALDNNELLEIAGLWRRDYQSGEQGYTLAAALLLGKDEVIQNILPHYKIDALVRIHNTHRYDDREYIKTNLIDAYEGLMEFVAKHLPDKFYLEGYQRVSLRAKIFREIAANLIVHREYTDAQPCTLIIYRDRVETGNANNPHGEGPIDPKNFAPFTKNPSIAKFFIQLGRVDELGSGVLNVNRLIKEYANKGTPQFIEGRIFRIVIPVPEIETGEGRTSQLREGEASYDEVGRVIGGRLGLSWEQADETLAPSQHQVGLKSALSWHQVEKLLKRAATQAGIQALMKELQWKDRSKFRARFISPLIQEELLTMTNPEKPTSSNQEYHLTKKGKAFLQHLSNALNGKKAAP